MTDADGDTDTDSPEPRPVPVAPYEEAPSSTGVVAGGEDGAASVPEGDEVPELQEGDEGVVGALEVGGL